MAQPTVVVTVGDCNYAQKTDQSMWCTTVVTNGVPDFSQATPVALTDDGGANRFTGVRSALRGAMQAAQSLTVTIEYIDS